MVRSHLKRLGESYKVRAQKAEDTDAFAKAIEVAENRSIVLQVWSSKRQELRGALALTSLSLEDGGLSSRRREGGAE